MSSIPWPQEKKGVSILSAGHAVAYAIEKDAADFFSGGHPFQGRCQIFAPETQTRSDVAPLRPSRLWLTFAKNLTRGMDDINEF